MVIRVQKNEQNSPEIKQLFEKLTVEGKSADSFDLDFQSRSFGAPKLAVIVPYAGNEKGKRLIPSLNEKLLSDLKKIWDEAQERISETLGPQSAVPMSKQPVQSSGNMASENRGIRIPINELTSWKIINSFRSMRVSGQPVDAWLYRCSKEVG